MPDGDDGGGLLSIGVSAPGGDPSDDTPPEQAINRHLNLAVQSNSSGEALIVSFCCQRCPYYCVDELTAERRRLKTTKY
jgi:hypothetical protein